MQTNAYDWRVLEKSALEPIHINSNELLVQYCQHWLSLPMIAIDTEFQRVDTYYPIAGLIQVGDDKHCCLIDPLCVTDYTPLIEVFQNAGVLKIIHAGSEDLELFQQLLGVVPQPLFDTQIAAAYLGWGFTMGLQRMLEKVLDIRIGKAETTSNWLQRPLTKKQELYAALDVAYLIEVCQQQIQQMANQECYTWFLEDSVRSLAKYATVDDELDCENYYLRFSQMWNIADYKLVALKALSRWREIECRKRNLPRNWVLKNQSILSIINQWPQSLEQLSKVDDMRTKHIKTDGKEIIAILEQAKTDLLEKGPVEAITKPIDPQWNKRLRKIKQLGQRFAQEQGVSSEIVLKKKDLEALVRTKEVFGEYRLPENLQGWRGKYLGDDILAYLKQFD